MNTSGGNLPNASYRRCETLNPDYPKKIEPGKTATARLIVGEGLNQQTPVDVKLRLRLHGVEQAEFIRVAVNGHSSDAKSTDDDWFESTIPKADLLKGQNTIDVAVSSEASEPASWLDAVIEVRQINKE